MCKGQARRVEERALQSLHRPHIVGHVPVDATVRRVADDRVANRAQVDANLMRSAGGDRDVQQRDAPQVLRLGDTRDRAPRTPCAGGHLLPVAGVASDRLVDAASGLDDAPDERDVFLLDLAVVELTRELAMRRVILRDHHHARRAAIEPVHDPRPELSTDSAQVVHMVEQRVDERAAGMPGRGVDDHSGRLVEHDDVGVLIQDGERKVLRCRNVRLVAVAA